MMRKNGQFIKVVGGDFGVYFKSGKPIRFECIGCMYAEGILKPTDRIQGFLPQGFNMMPVMHRHDIAIHKKWLLDGKPILKQERK